MDAFTFAVAMFFGIYMMIDGAIDDTGVFNDVIKNGPSKARLKVLLGVLLLSLGTLSLCIG